MILFLLDNITFNIKLMKPLTTKNFEAGWGKGVTLISGSQDSPEV